MLLRLENPSRGAARAAAAFVLTAIVFIAAPFTAWAADSITLTWVRHGESRANADGVIDTKVPGPGLTALGAQQAKDVAAVLAASPHDAIYVSDMIRTSQTAEPYREATGLPVKVLPGLREINAGIFEGAPQDTGIRRILYGSPAIAWTLGLRFVPIIGSTDSNGNEFDARTNKAIREIYTDGYKNPVLFSHGLTISTWTMMNVDNPDPLLILTHPLDNTAIVVVTGNPTDGWTLVSWDGIAVDPNPGLPKKLFVGARDRIVAPQEATADADIDATVQPDATVRLDATVEPDATGDADDEPPVTLSPRKTWKRAVTHSDSAADRATATSAKSPKAEAESTARKEGKRDNVIRNLRDEIRSRVSSAADQPSGGAAADGNDDATDNGGADRDRNAA